MQRHRRPRETVEQLLARFRDGGDPHALSGVFDRTAPELFRLSLAWTPDAATAEDALQETFLAVLEQVHRWDPSRPALPWLVGILQNKAARARRARRRAPEPLLVPPRLSASGPEATAQRGEDIARVRAAIARLPEPYRAVGLLRWQHGLTPAEIAEIRGEPPGTVRSILSRALRKLRSELGGARALPAIVGAWGRPERGLTAIRREVLRHATARTVATLGCGLGAAATLEWAAGAALPFIGGALMVKKAAVLAIVIALGVALWLQGGASAPERAMLPSGGSSDAAAATTPASRHRARVEPLGETEPFPQTDVAPSGRTVDVTVRVEGSDARPVGDALVTAYVARRESEGNAPLRRGALCFFDQRRPGRQVVTDQHGAASFSGLSAATWAFSAEKEGFARATTFAPGTGVGVDLSLADDRETIVIRLAAAHTLQGRVVDEDRAPVAGAVVAVAPGFSPDYEGIHVGRATSDESGTFSVTSLPAGPARVVASRAGAYGTTKQVSIPHVGPLEITVRAPGHVVGRVLDAATGSPVGGAVVRALSSGFAPSEAASDEDGSFRLPWCADAPIAYLVAEKAGFVTAPLDAAVPAGAVVSPRSPSPTADARRVLSIQVPSRSEVRQDVLVVRGARIHGVVRGPDGPIAGAVVSATTGRENYGVWALPATSDAGGLYELDSVAPGPVLLTVHAEGYYAAGHPRVAWAQAVRPGAPASAWRLDVAAGGDVERDLVLERGVTLEGVVVTDAGTPLAGAEVHALQSDMGWRRARTTSAADGTFRLAGVVPETTASVWAVKDGWCLEADAVKADPASADEVVLRMLPEFRVSGTVSDADGALPPPGTTVAVSVLLEPPASGLGAPTGATAAVGADGRFEIAVTAPRRLKVTFLASAPGRDPGGAGPFPAEDLRRGRTVDLRLQSQEILRGRVVVRGTGAPVADAPVSSGYVWNPAVARTDAAGRFEIRGRDPGAHAGAVRKLFVVADGFAIGRASAATAAAAGGGDVLVELTPVLEIDGTVRYADGAPASGAVVGAERTQPIDGSWYEFGEAGIGPFRSECVVGDDGRFRLRGLADGRYVLLVRPSKDGTARVLPVRSTSVSAGSRDVALVVVRRTDVMGADAFDAMSDADLGRHAIWRLMQKDPEGAAAAWEALLVRPIADDGRAEALDLYANGPLRTLGRRDAAVAAFRQAVALTQAGALRRARAFVDLAATLTEMERYAQAADAAHSGEALAAGKDEFLEAYARFRGAQALARLGDATASGVLAALRDQIAGRRDGAWGSLRAMVDAELRR